MPGTRRAQREATEAALIAEARQRFATEGYASVRLSDVVDALGLTKGALYHQFSGKKDLFLAVLRQVQQEVADRVQAAAQPCADPWKELVAGCEAFLASYSNPETRQIMLIDAPTVLGWREWKEMDGACSERLLTEVLTSLVEDGTLVPRPVEPVVHLLSGAMNEAALWLAETDSPTALKDTMDALQCLVGSLRADGIAPAAEASSVEGMSKRLPSSDSVVLKGIREEPGPEDGAANADRKSVV